MRAGDRGHRLGPSLAFRAPVRHPTRRAAQEAGRLRHRSLHRWGCRAAPCLSFPTGSGAGGQGPSELAEGMRCSLVAPGICWALQEGAQHHFRPETLAGRTWAGGGSEVPCAPRCRTQPGGARTGLPRGKAAPLGSPWLSFSFHSPLFPFDQDSWSRWESAASL